MAFIYHDMDDWLLGLEQQNFTVDHDGFLVVYTDGACVNNGRRGALAGIGVWWGDNNDENVSELVTGSRHTNNTAEIQAAIKAITLAGELGAPRLNIRTDSEFLVNCATIWMPRWKQNGWRCIDGHAVVNQDDLRTLDYHPAKLLGFTGWLGNLAYLARFRGGVSPSSAPLPLCPAGKGNSREGHLLPTTVIYLSAPPSNAKTSRAGNL